MKIDELLEKWYEAKNKKTKLEDRIEKYKKAVNKLMNKEKTTKLVGRDYSVSKRNNSRVYMSKDSVPASIWNQYASRCTYEAYYLTKNR